MAASTRSALAPRQPAAAAARHQHGIARWRRAINSSAQQQRSARGKQQRHDGSAGWRHPARMARSNANNRGAARHIGVASAAWQVAA